MRRVPQLLAINLAFLHISTIAISQPTAETKVMILGSIHLASVKPVSDTMLSRILDSLSQHNFDAIAIEQMPAELILDIGSREQEHWKDLFKYYQGSISIGRKIQQLYGLGFVKAGQMIDSLLTKSIISEDDRRRLVSYYLAAYDPWSALLQFHYIADKTTIDTTLVSVLKPYINWTAEMNLLAVSLAKRLGINRLEYIDSHQDETILLREYSSFLPALKDAPAFKDLMQKPVYKKIHDLKSQGVLKKDLYPLFKFMNSDEYMHGDNMSQWMPYLTQTNFPDRSDHSRYYLWEMRNLQIAANILRTIAKYPGKNLLVIIGGAHKLFLTKYLQQVPGVELMEF